MVFYFVLGIILGFLILSISMGISMRVKDKRKKRIWKKRMEEANREKCVKKAVEQIQNQEKVMENGTDRYQETRQLVVETLREIGCQPEQMDNGDITVAFQGENFVIQSGHRFIQVWDLGWSSVNVIDPELDNIKLAINRANLEYGPSVGFSRPDENGNIFIHTRGDSVFTSDLPHLGDYLKSMLVSFFEKKQSVHHHYNQLRADQERAEANERPVDHSSETNMN